MNFKSPEMEGHIPRTDSRWRSDLRFYEEGNIDESEVEKVKIEQRQRRVRKWVEEGKHPSHQPKFFKQIPHPYMKKEYWDTGDVIPVLYDLVDGEKGYWERRKNQDWQGLPNLWGPYTDE